MSISALGYYPNPLHPNREEADKVVAHLKKVMEGAKRLGIDRVNTFVGRDWNQSLEGNWPRFLQTWQPLVEHAERLDLRVGIENCPMLFTRDEWPGGKNLAVSPEIWRRMYEAIPSPNWGLNFDPSHCVWQQMCYLRRSGNSRRDWCTFTRRTPGWTVIGWTMWESWPTPTSTTPRNSPAWAMWIGGDSSRN